MINDKVFGIRKDIDFIYEPALRKTNLKFKDVKCLHCNELKIA